MKAKFHIEFAGKKTTEDISQRKHLKKIIILGIILNRPVKK